MGENQCETGEKVALVPVAHQNRPQPSQGIQIRPRRRSPNINQDRAGLGAYGLISETDSYDRNRADCSNHQGTPRAGIGDPASAFPIHQRENHRPNAQSLRLNIATSYPGLANDLP